MTGGISDLQNNGSIQNMHVCHITSKTCTSLWMRCSLPLVYCLICTIEYTYFIVICDMM